MTDRTRARVRATGRPAPLVNEGSPLQLLLSDRLRTLGDERQGYPLTYQQVVDRSKGRVSKSTVSNVLHGKAVKLTEETIVGLAVALEIPEDVLRDAILQSMDSNWKLPSRVQQLGAQEWRELLKFADFLLDQQRRK